MFIKIDPCKDFFQSSKVLKFANLAFLYPIFFPTVKSWGNGLSFIMLAVALVNIIPSRRQYFLSRSKLFWLLFVTLISPFFLELIVQVCRGPFTWNSLDGPSRFLIGGVILLYLSKYQDIDSVVISFSLGCLICIPVTLLSVIIFDDFYWRGRCATQILCPNALPVYILSIGICGFYYLLSIKNLRLKLFYFVAVYLSLLYILIVCETRTVWISFVFIVTFIVILITCKSKIKLLLLMCIYFSSILILYFASPVIQKRVNTTFISATNLITEINEPRSLNTSLGARVGLILFDCYIGAKYNLLGYPDEKLPPMSTVLKDIPFMTNKVYLMKLTSGSHCEYTAHISRKGLVLGLFNSLSILILPLCFFGRILLLNRQKFSYTAFLIVLSMSICAVGVQVFGLKMSSSFWAVTLAIFYSYSVNLPRNSY